MMIKGKVLSKGSTLSFIILSIHFTDHMKNMLYNEYSIHLLFGMKGSVDDGGNFSQIVDDCKQLFSAAR